MNNINKIVIMDHISLINPRKIISKEEEIKLEQLQNKLFNYFKNLKIEFNCYPMLNRIYTKGNVEVQNIKVGDIHYEYGYGCYIKCRVITLPDYITNEDGTKYWFWQAEKINNGELINYGVTEGFSHYSPELYDYLPYNNCKEI